MKFKIDKRYIAIQSLLAIACYILGVFIILTFLEIKAPLDFVGSSLFAGVMLYFMFFFPRKVFIRDGIISFVENNHFERTKIILADISKVDYECKFYNTVIIHTKSGKKYKLHPMDATTLINYIQSHK